MPIIVKYINLYFNNISSGMRFWLRYTDGLKYWA